MVKIMHNQTVTFLTLLVLLGPVAKAEYTVQCEGYNEETSAYVYGECSEGSFEGYDSETGNYVYGDCSFGGSLDAYDSETDQYVYGNCEGE